MNDDATMEREMKAQIQAEEESALYCSGCMGQTTNYDYDEQQYSKVHKFILRILGGH